jgi:hypothetical protein
MQLSWAILNPHARVIVFDMEEKGRAALNDMAWRNNVTDLVEVLDKCEPADLQAALAARRSGCYMSR